MAGDAAPTLGSLTTEGIKMAGYTTPSKLALNRAQTEWMLDIKNNIWRIAKKLKSLQTTNIFVIVNGSGIIAYPSDFSSDLSMVLLDSEHFGVCQAGGSVTTAKLAADEDMSSDYAVGKEIVVYLTADKDTAYSGFITNFNTTTKIATFTLAIAVSPDATYSYAVINRHREITQKSVIRYDQLNNFANRGTPCHFYPIGGAASGNFYLYPVPDKTTATPWAIRQRYYANLMTLDLAGALIATLYQRWRDVFIQGVFLKQLKDDDDARVPKEEVNYRRSLADLTARETYGQDLSNLQTTLVE